VDQTYARVRAHSRERKASNYSRAFFRDAAASRKENERGRGRRSRGGGEGEGRGRRRRRKKSSGGHKSTVFRITDCTHAPGRLKRSSHKYRAGNWWIFKAHGGLVALAADSVRDGAP